MWTDNADQLSILYSGTPALKTDFTRTGQRTRYGAINDFRHSLRRYYINNFCDGYNHDCLDMSQKKLTPTSALVSRSWLSAFKLTLIGLAGTFYATSVLLNTYLPLPEFLPGGDDTGNFDQRQSVQLTHLIVYAGVITLGWGYLYTNRKSFVDGASRFV